MNKPYHLELSKYLDFQILYGRISMNDSEMININVKIKINVF